MNNDLLYLYSIIKKNPPKSSDIYEQKKLINKKLHLLYSKYLPMTNDNSNNNYIEKDFTYKYNYQRYDGELVYNDFVKKFYNLENVHSKAIFTSSGMSSIFAVLAALSYHKNYMVKYHKDIYFETQKIIKKLPFKKKNVRKIYYLDTISNYFSFDSQYKNSIVIIDTTCYHSFDFKNMVNKLLNNNCFCILVRSHTKLDMLGLEYSTLGSIIYLIPSGINKKRFSKYKEIIDNSMNILGCLGMFAQESNIFPLLINKKIIDLNKKRINRIKRNNRYFFDKMKDYLLISKHNLFCITKDINNYSNEDLKRIVKCFSETNKDICRFSASFGFDYIAIDTYIDLNNKKNVIRISIGDVENKIIDAFIKKIVILLKELKNDKI